MIKPHYNAIEQSAHHLVANFGADNFAALLHKNPNTIRNEVNSHVTGAKLGLVDAVRMMQLACNFELLQQVCMECGFIAVPLPKNLMTDSCVVKSLTHWQAKFGETAQTIHWALEDNFITPNEKLAIQRVGLQKIAAFCSVLNALEPLEVRHANCTTN
jgi:hypothetical protein